MAEETKKTKKVVSQQNKKPIKKGKKKKKKHKILRVVGIVFLLSLVIGWFTIGTKVLELRDEAKELVAKSSEKTFKEAQTSIVYDTNGKQLTKLRGEKDAYYLKYKDIPLYTVAAVISVEDRNFYQHDGVDLKGIARAAVSYVAQGGTVTQGGSTLTQQLAKTVFLSRERTWTRKVKEMFCAWDMEKKYTKEQILEFYLNNVYYANSYYGIQAASQGYFRKDAKDLTMSQAAFLCGIPNSPSMYDPRKNKDNAMERRDKILKDMREQELITKDQYEEAINEKIKVYNEKKTERKNYVETYVIHCATKELMKEQGFNFKTSFDSNSQRKKYNKEYNKVYAECKRNLYSEGYHIYTSIDPDIQDDLQDSVDGALKGYKSKDKNGIYKTQAAGTAIDNETGKVVAIVGGREQKNIGYTLNRAYQSPRQPGSSIKPLLVFAPALERGYGPGSIVNDNPMSTRDKHRVRNSGESYSGRISLRRAVQKSSNVVTMRLYEKLGPDKALRYLEKMNFKYLTQEDYKYYTTCLGGFTKGATTEEMAAGYATLVNDGKYRDPTCITKITTADGDEVMKSSVKKTSVYSESAAKNMTSVLQSVVTSGTGVGAKIPNVDTAGKTGTTTSNRDGWFCGYTPYYSTAIWVGRDDNKIMPELSGGSFPKTIWTNFMKKIHKSISNRKNLEEASNDDSDTDSDSGYTNTGNYTYRNNYTTTSSQRTTSAAPTTSAPTTSAPTTSEPTTSAPTTSAPTTSAPATTQNNNEE